MRERTFEDDVRGCKDDLRAATRHYSPTVIATAAHELAYEHARRAAEWAYKQRVEGPGDA